MNNLYHCGVNHRHVRFSRFPADSYLNYMKNAFCGLWIVLYQSEHLVLKNRTVAKKLSRMPAAREIIQKCFWRQCCRCLLSVLVGLRRLSGFTRATLDQLLVALFLEAVATVCLSVLAWCAVRQLWYTTGLSLGALPNELLYPNAPPFNVPELVANRCKYHFETGLSIQLLRNCLHALVLPSYILTDCSHICEGIWLLQPYP